MPRRGVVAVAVRFSSWVAVFGVRVLGRRLPEADVAGGGYREGALLDAAGVVVEPVECTGGEVVVVEEVVDGDASAEAPPAVEVVVEQLVLGAGIDAVAVAAGQEHDAGDGDGAAEVDEDSSLVGKGAVGKRITVEALGVQGIDFTLDRLAFRVEEYNFRKIGTHGKVREA